MSEIWNGDTGQKFNGKDLEPEIIGDPLSKELAVYKKNQTTISCKLRIVITDDQGVVRTNNSYDLRPEKWENDLDRIANFIPGLTNQMKLTLKRDGYVRIDDIFGITEFIIQVHENKPEEPNVIG